MSDFIHAKPGDVMVGRLRDPGGSWRDAVYLRDLAPWARFALQRAMSDAKRVCDQTPGPGHTDGCPDGFEPFTEEGVVKP